MTLKDFQNSNGIALGKQILTIQNTSFPSDYDFYFDETSLKFQKLQSTIQTCRKANNSLKSEITVFYGYFDKSCNNLRTLLRVLKMLKHKCITVIIGKGDYEINEKIIASIPRNVNRIYANNVNTSDPRVYYYPMGRDFRSKNLFDEVLPSEQKTTLVYANFSVNTHPIRREVSELIATKSYIVKEHMGNFLDYNVSRKDFYTSLSRSKFSICPRGNAIDTFRFWDSLYLGSIPIVVKEASYQSLLTKLPILFLSDYKEFGSLDPDALEETYQSMLYREYDYNLLDFSYWLPHQN